MHATRLLLLRTFLALLGCATGGSALAQGSVLTERYDNARSGANLAETQLNTANVNTSQFGKLWSYAVDGSVFAQPLYFPGASIPGVGTRNVLYVVTMNDVVYAFDADSTATLWKRDLRNLAAGVSAVPIVDVTGNFNNLNIVGTVGIESTPVIDSTSNTLYLVARTKENGSYFQRLHALDIATGAERAGSPATIQGSVSGTGDGGNTVSFNPRTGNQRASLALAHGQIYIAWASHEDFGSWHGWVMSYHKTSLARTGILCVTPNGTDGGIWMGGRAPAVDANEDVYYMVGNGDWNGTSNFGESFIKLGAPNAGQLPVLSQLTPGNWVTLIDPSVDFDLGSSGPMLIPPVNPSMIIGGGKESLLYLTSTANLGGLLPNPQVQTLTVNAAGAQNGYQNDYYILGGGPVYWNRSGGFGPWLYVWADNDYLNAYHFNNNSSTFDTTPVSLSTTAAQPHGGGVMTLSANASAPGSGIIWASMPANDDADHGLVHGLLRALDADNIATELWNSDQNPQQLDNMGFWPKFSPPTVVNGRVYMASFSGYVSVYGLLPTAPYFMLSATVPAVPAPMPAGELDPGPVAAANPGGSPTYAITANASSGFSGTITLSVNNASLPAGTTASWSSTSIAAGATATLTLNTSLNTPIGSYQLLVNGVSGSQTQTASIALVVRPARVISLEFWTSPNLAPACTPNGMDVPEIAGVVARPYWNNNEYNIQPNPISPTPAPLNDETGAPTGGWASWNANAESGNPNVPDMPGNDRLMRCYLDPSASSSATVTVSNLPANDGGYDIYVYADGNNGGTATTGTYQISGPGITTSSLTITDAANANFNGTYVRANNSAGNYAVFGITGTGFTLNATALTSHAPINGIQIVPDRIFKNGFD